MWQKFRVAFPSIVLIVQIAKRRFDIGLMLAQDQVHSIICQYLILILKVKLLIIF